SSTTTLSIFGEVPQAEKYTTSVTKTKAADYGQIKWIEDLVPRTMWIQEPLNYDKHALWGVSYWGRKHHQFYGFAVNRESALDIYSKRRIIAITDLKIVEWHNYKHLDSISIRRDDEKIYKFKEGDFKRLRLRVLSFSLNRESARDVYSKRRIIAIIEVQIVEWHDYKHLDWISVRRDDDQIYKFKEGDFKRLRLQDIKDMLLLLVHGKLSNLTVEERLAFNKRLNLMKPDTYRPDLRRREAYTAHSNPRGFIDQNKDTKNILMRINELHKFSDETLNDVRNALDDRLKGIRMQYLPTTIWSRGNKERAAAMIQAIDKMLKTRRIMRSLEKFVGGRLRIIAVTDLKIVEWHNYKHLDWISDVYKEYLHLTAHGRSSTGSQKLPEEAQPYEARHGIKMQYLPQTIWRKGDKDRATAMK
nr:hypothetical protein [Tanacetum cinerariifolium]